MWTDDPQTCRRCGGARHSYHGDCPRDLHGRADPFKTRCAVCETPIPSQAFRVGDTYDNLYCDLECMNRGYETLIERFENPDAAAGGLTEVTDGA